MFVPLHLEAWRKFEYVCSFSKVFLPESSLLFIVGKMCRAPEGASHCDAVGL